MIDGVTILKQYDFALSTSLIVILSILTGIFFFFLIKGFWFNMESGVVNLVPLIWGVMIGLLAAFYLKSDNSSPCRYDVIIDDSVSVNELYKDYEILKVEGKIYTITLREK